MLGPQNEDQRRLKLESDEILRAKITTRIRGQLKRQFLNDTVERDLKESKLAEFIFRIHYALIDEFPELKRADYSEMKGMDCEAVKKYIMERVRFK